MVVVIFFFFQAEDGIRDLVRSRGLGDVYKRQFSAIVVLVYIMFVFRQVPNTFRYGTTAVIALVHDCLLYTSDAADERSSVDLGGRRIIKKKTTKLSTMQRTSSNT